MRPASFRNSLIPLLLYLVVGGLIYLWDFGGYAGELHGWAQRLTTPLEERLYKVRLGVQGAFWIFGNLRETQKKADEVQERNSFLEAKLSEMAALREENEHARRLLGAGLPSSWKFEPVRVVGGYADSLAVGGIGDVGEVGGRTVISTEGDGGIYVGRVEKVVGQQAEVFLPTKDSEKIPVRVRNRDTGDLRASGILVGRGGRAIIDQVLTGEVLEEGDLVLTAGDEGDVPPELLVGYVAKILPVTGAFQQAEMTQAIDYRKLDSAVFVITKF